MQLTTFGLLFLPLVAMTALFARTWLPALVVLSTCLQATSVLNLPVGEGAFGISPYNATALFVSIVLVVSIWQLRSLPRPPESLRQPAYWLMAYVVVAVIGAFVLPFVHSGVPVYLLLNKFGFDRGTTPLVFTLSNAVQAANLAIHAVVLVYLLQARRFSDSVFLKMLYGLSAAVLLVLMIGFYERMASLGHGESFNSFWMNNPGYAQLHYHMVAGFRRIVAPFSEASYATTFLAAVWAGLLAVCLFGRCRPWHLLALALVGIGLVNPMGSTGWVAAGVMAVALLFIATVLALSRRHATDRPTLRRRVMSGWATVLFVCLAGLWAWTASPAGPKIQTVVDTVLLNKLASGSAKVRHRSNERAVQIVKDTWGMGAGLGSNRASSFMASLISNTGVPGLLLFVGMLGTLTWRYLGSRNLLTDGQLFTVTALWTATLAMTLAIPDMNLPVYWVFIFLAFLGCPGLAGTQQPTGHELGTAHA